MFTGQLWYRQDSKDPKEIHNDGFQYQQNINMNVNANKTIHGGKQAETNNYAKTLDEYCSQDNYGTGKTTNTLKKFTLVVFSISKIWTMNMNSNKTIHVGKQAEINYYIRNYMNIAHRTTIVQVRQQIP